MSSRVISCRCVIQLLEWPVVYPVDEPDSRLLAVRTIFRREYSRRRTHESLAHRPSLSACWRLSRNVAANPRFGHSNKLQSAHFFSLSSSSIVSSYCWRLERRSVSPTTVVLFRRYRLKYIILKIVIIHVCGIVERKENETLVS